MRLPKQPFIRTSCQDLSLCLLSAVDDLALHLGEWRDFSQTYLEKEFLRPNVDY